MTTHQPSHVAPWPIPPGGRPRQRGRRPGRSALMVHRLRVALRPELALAPRQCGRPSSRLGSWRPRPSAPDTVNPRGRLAVPPSREHRRRRRSGRHVGDGRALREPGGPPAVGRGSRDPPPDDPVPARARCWCGGTGCGAVVSEPGFPALQQVVLDSTDARRLAEFYRALLGYRYRVRRRAPSRRGRRPERPGLAGPGPPFGGGACRLPAGGRAPPVDVAGGRNAAATAPRPDRSGRPVPAGAARAGARTGRPSAPGPR